MPTYDFRCSKCSHHFEVILPFGSTKRPLCPRCRHAKTEKLIAPPAIHFKGTGFFKTDNRKVTEKKEIKPKESETTKKESSAEEPKTDKKKG